MVTLKFMGANRTVTGSKHLLTHDGYRLLVDCGMYQGMKRLRQRNWDDFPVPVNSLNALALTHAHIDHCGYLPRIVAGGFSNKVYATPPTCDIAEILLLDSSRLQEEEAGYANKEGFSKHRPALPLYTEEDARKTLPLLTPVDYEKKCKLGEGLDICFKEAGHILGSAMIEARFTSGGKRKKILFTGDLGRKGTPMLQDPAEIQQADYVVLESTYGMRLHQQKDRKSELAHIIRSTMKKRGVLLIPAFAVERTQELLYILHLLKASKDIPDVPVFVDSPMAVRVTRIFSRYRETFDDDAQDLIKTGGEILQGPHFNLCEKVQQSKQLNRMQGPLIIISASGMATGGRILHHLKHRLTDKKNTVLLVGYQAMGTRGRRLQEGEKKIKIHGEHVAVKSRVVSLDGFSSHADYDEILTWLGKFKKAPEKIFLVHGELDAAQSLKEKIEKKYQWPVEIPAYLDEVEL